VIGMMYRSVKHRRDHERQVVLLARIIEVRGGDDDDYAERFLRAVVNQAKPRDKAVAVKLAADVEAWRRARRTYRCFFQ
jgi:chorismate mutase